MPAIPTRPARCRRCMTRFSSWRRRKPPATTTASSIAISPGARPRRAATMAPDADAGKSSGHRADPFAPLTSQLLPVGDSHEVYVETVGRPDGIPAIYLHGGPGSGCQPDHRRLFDPERFHAVLFDQRGAGRSRPKGRREANTLPHLIADMETIREKLDIPRWMVVGGSWGATLALAYAQAHPDRVSCIVLRATFLGTRTELEGAFLHALPRFYPGLNDDFLNLLPAEERAEPLGAYWRRILDSDPAMHGPFIRAWHDTEQILSQHAPRQDRLDLASLKSTGDLLCPPAISDMVAARWREAEIHVVEGAGHSLYDPGVRDAVMRAIADLAS